MCKYRTMDNIFYIHFDERDLCNRFIEYIRKKKIYITDTCCNGKGCQFSSLSNNKERIQKMKNKFLKRLCLYPHQVTETDSFTPLCVSIAENVSSRTVLKSGASTEIQCKICKINKNETEFNSVITVCNECKCLPYPPYKNRITKITM